MFLCPSRTPGSVSTSTSLSAALCDFGEAADLRLGELDVVDHLRRQAVDQRLDLRLRQPELLRLPFVELRRQFAHRRVATAHDIVEDGLDRLADLAIGLEFLFLGRTTLQIADHR